MNLREAARALGGEVSGRRILAPGPGHSRADRSLSVWIDGNGVRVHSYCGDDWRDCQQHVRQSLGLPGWAPDREERPAPIRRPTAPPTDTKDTGEAARRIWRETIDPRGTLAEVYLARERCLPGCLDGTLSLTLRFHGACPFRDGDVTVRAPAVIAALRDPYVVMSQCQKLGELGEVERWILRKPELVMAVQRIRLDRDAHKVERRSLGAMGNGVVFIGSIWDGFYQNTACIAEGVETALAMRTLGFPGCVALAGAGRFKTFEPPFHWADIVISGENDTGASESAWRDAGPRWAREGREVRVWAPPPGFKDANDLIRKNLQGARAA